MPTLRHEYLPVFKMRAFDDLTARRARGDSVRSGDIGKHRRDIFRLVAMLPQETRIDLPEPVREEVRRFLELVDPPSRNYMKSIGLGNVTLDEIMAAIRSAYLA